MIKQDARRLTHSTLTELRKRAVTQVQTGVSPEVVIKALGISRQAMYNWLALYRAGGLDALNAKKRGGRHKKLEAKEIRWIYRTIVGKNPMQLQFPFALWTGEIVAEVIFEKFGVKLSRWSVTRLLGQLGLTPQRPTWRACEQDPKLVKRWLRYQFPRIKVLARKQHADIYFGDEAGVRSDYHAGKTWAPRGTTPVVTGTGQRFGLNILSAISCRGKMKFMLVAGRVNTGRFIEFLRRMIKDSTRMVFLVVDGHSIHRAKVVKKFLKSVKNRLRLFILPPYSPELNPDEGVWRNLKVHRIGRKAIISKNDLVAQVRHYMLSLQRKRDDIRALFQFKTTLYAMM